MSNSDFEKQMWALEAYASSAKILPRAKTAEELIQGVCAGISNQYPYVISWVGIAENDTQKSVRVAGISGKARAYAEGIIVTWDGEKSSGQGPTGEAIRSGRSQVMNDSFTELKFTPWADRAKQYGIRSSVAIPMFGNEKIIGALMVYATEPHAFLPPELRLFEDLANEIGYGLASLEARAKLEKEIEKKELAQKKLLESLELTIVAMGATMEMRDPYTSGHQKKVASISQSIASQMGWPKDRIQGLKMAALVHDIGKVSIPSELLTKPSRLSIIEYALMKEHVTNGYLILKDIPFVWPIAETVRQHHERMDGSGYPRGLKGEEILPEARILAVADIIDSMSTHRPYRPALGLDKALTEINSRAGKDLDVEVVAAAQKIFETGELKSLLNEI